MYNTRSTKLGAVWVKKNCFHYFGQLPKSWSLSSKYNKRECEKRKFESESELNEDYHYISCDWQAPTAQGRHFCLFQGHNLPATDAISLYIQPIAFAFWYN